MTDTHREHVQLHRRKRRTRAERMTEKEEDNTMIRWGIIDPVA